MLALTVIIHFIAAGLLMALMNWAGLERWRRAADAHWTERARLLWPVRFTAALGIFFVPFVLNLAHTVLFPEDDVCWLVLAVAGVGGAVLGCYPLDRKIFPQLNFTGWRRQIVALWGIRFGIWAALVAGCILMPAEFGGRMILVAVGYLFFHALFNWGLFLRWLRLIKFLRPPDARLQNIVDVVTAKMGGAKVRATWRMDGSLATAFALPTTRELVFSDRMLEICTDEEVSAICAHEVAHLKESKAVLTGRLFGSLTLFPLIFINPLTQRLGLWGLLIAYALVFVMMRFAKSLSLRMEKRADALALQEQTDEGVYARALEKLYRDSQTPAVNVNNRQTHPHLYDRMLAAGITPDFPRPARPKRLTPVGWTLLCAFFYLIVLSAWATE